MLSSTLMHKKGVVGLCSVVFTLFCSFSFAEQQQDGLYTAKAALLSVMLNFQLYESSQGDSQYWDEMMQSAKNLTLAMDQLGEQKTLRSQWALTAKHLSSASVSIKRGGFLEPGKQKQYHNAIKQMWNQLDQLEAKTIANETGADIQELHLLILQLTLRYLYPEYHLQGIYHDQSIAQMAVLADHSLKQLNSTHTSDSLQKLLQNWSLLYRFFQEPGQQAVPFMVTRFTHACSKELSMRINTM